MNHLLLILSVLIVVYIMKCRLDSSPASPKKEGYCAACKFA